MQGIQPNKGENDMVNQINMLETKDVVQTSTQTNVLVIKDLMQDELKAFYDYAANVNQHDLYLTFEQVANAEMFEKYLQREQVRPIGFIDKVRGTLIQHENKADLVLTASLSKANLFGLLKLYHNIIGREIDMNDMEISDEAIRTSASVKWGVPLPAERPVKQFHKYSIYQLKGEAVYKSTFQHQSICAALATTLNIYNSDDLDVYFNKLTLAGQTVIKGKLHTDGTINTEQHAEQKDNHIAYSIGIICIDVDHEKYEYTPYLSPKYPLSVVVQENAGIVQSLSLQANADMMDAEVLKQFGTMLEYVLTTSDSVSNSTMASYVEELMAPYIRETNKSSQENILERLKKIVQLYPHNIALSDQQGNMTFEELEQRSDIIAKRLIKEGFNAEDKAVISVNQDHELILLMIGVIKAGGVYIPVDPNYPAERISFILKDSAAQFFISNLSHYFEDTNYIKIHPAELLQQTKLEQIHDIPLPAYTPQSGYVIYTSGTSGVPKGVQVPCENIISLIEATQKEFELSANDVWTMFHSSSFDFSVWEMWGSLLTGAKLVVVPRETATSLYDYYELLIEHKVTVLNQTPSSFYALQNIESEQRTPRLNSIRLIIFGGEALDNTKLKKWFQRYSSSKCRLVNMYGITETTVHVTHQNILKKNLDISSQSIGEPIKGWKISIRDADGASCLLGVEGEIWVGGAGLSQGYLNRVELNREKFIIDETSGERWYKSGDLGRMKSDGSIDYLGRIDSQVKIRGYRIELDEIKKQISRVPGVRDVVVTVHNTEKHADEHKQILAFFESNKAYNSNEMKEILLQVMPSYMIPSNSVQVNEIPLTINGKVDFKKLINEQNEPYQSEKNSTSGENVLLDIWSKILGKPITDEDSFFDCGGNSLLAVSLLSELKQKVSPDLTLKELYLHSSPNRMRTFLEQKEWGDVRV
ncbi:non-ribosomal peptide synthetase [Paenibacillus amylolyticus]|uniref:non-ribosomal peptide synthetase n=1 Tax=Paenibacillus amylolyticus TaxID=1451 RepID=UPI003EC1180E